MSTMQDKIVGKIDRDSIVFEITDQLFAHIRYPPSLKPFFNM